MNCMQYYGHDKAGAELLRFNTASGMNCMQLLVMKRKMEDIIEFQYRKRYELHAIF